MPSRSRAIPGGLLGPILLILLLAGCASDTTDRRGRPDPLPTLSGRQHFFDDRITAEVTIGAMPRPPRPEDASGNGEAREGHHRRPGGFGHGMGGGPGRPPRDGEDEDRPGPRAGTGLRQAGPPVMIHLRFTNHGAESVELRIADFLSPLGNFVVQPEVLTLGPGATVAAEPLSSSLARQTAGGDITLKLRLGEREETKVVPLEIEASPRPGTGKNGQAL